MKSMKKCKSTKQNQISINKIYGLVKLVRHRRDSSAGMFYTSSAGAVTSLILMLALLFIFSLTGATNLFGLNGNTYATTSTITISVIDKIALNFTSTSTTGIFATSDTTTSNISVSTNNGTGYTLGIKASTEGSNALSYTDTTTSTTYTIPSHTVSVGVSKANYEDNTYASTNNLNNTWGYRPSKLNSQANSNYLPGPSSASNLTILDQTTSANPSTANNYNLAIGARINSSTTPGTYGNTFIITVVANPTIYSITYNANATGVSNMPANVVNQFTDAETVDISSTVPVRDGYDFKGWCTVQTTDGGACSGTTYNPDGGGTAITWTIEPHSNNSLSLYAIWAVASHCKPTGTTITTIGCMQDITSSNKSTVLSSMTQGTQYRLYDSRDDQQYWVAKQADGNIWMTQNLDLDIGGTNTAALTSENTDLNTSGSGIYVDGYDNSTGVIIWTPDNTAKTSDRTISGTTVTGWTNNSNEPYSAEGGDNYYYTTGNTSNETAQTLTQCKANHTEGECKHYHVGNYYNWTAAIASNASNNIGSTSQVVAANSICPKGWKLPQGRTSSASDAATRQFGNLWYQAGVTGSVNATSYVNNGFTNIRSLPLFFVRGGDINGNLLYDSGSCGYYWSSSVRSTSSAYRADFDNSAVNSAHYIDRGLGQSLRCMVR